MTGCLGYKKAVYAYKKPKHNASTLVSGLEETPDFLISVCSGSDVWPAASSTHFQLQSRQNKVCLFIVLFFLSLLLNSSSIYQPWLIWINDTNHIEWAFARPTQFRITLAAKWATILTHIFACGFSPKTEGFHQVCLLTFEHWIIERRISTSSSIHISEWGVI